MKLAGCVFIVFIAITISGNVSVYPGETTTFTCKLNTQGIDGVTFQWVKLNGTNVTFFNENLDTEASGVGSTQNYNFTSTFSVMNVNYSDNSIGFYCNASGCTASMTAYLTGNCTGEYVKSINIPRSCDYCYVNNNNDVIYCSYDSSSRYYSIISIIAQSQ